ncbi:hypothetical protein Lal_00024651 [Lupinus albus]|nr:hypothetical protein Lal_00024651 [Lupinus albus]
MENQEEYTDKVIEEFEVLTKDAERVQREVLKSILEENASAEYLQSLGLNGRTDPESFKACVPLVTHDDLLPYINRIFDGENSPILTGKPITAMSFRSHPHPFLALLKLWDNLRSALAQITMVKYVTIEFPIKNGMALTFNYSSKQSQTKGGIKIGSATSHLFRHEGYTDGEDDSQSCSPEEVIFCSDFQQSLYCHLLCGLIFKDQVQFVSAPFAHSIVQAFSTFEQVWEELCNDIREGVLSSKITDPSIRTAMSKILKPDPELANLIHKKCTGLSNWYGVIQELFPNAKYLFAIMTGTMETYLQRLRHYAGDLPLVTSDYASSEGWIATNLHPKVPPELATYTVFPQIAYFEFIPLSEDPKPVSLTEVKVGEEYEIVMTTRTGLYRYKLGDVVKVTGFYNSTPELKFIRRSNVLLTVNIDKTTENDLYLSVVAASKLLEEKKLYVVDYTSYVDFSKEPGHYVIFWEISGEASEEVLGECCNCLDKSFVDPAYVYSRKANHIGPLELRVVKRGTFQKIPELFVEVGASVSQFKIPRCVPPANTKLLQILNANVDKNYISAAFN